MRGGTSLQFQKERKKQKHGFPIEDFGNDGGRWMPDKSAQA